MPAEGAGYMPSFSAHMLQRPPMPSFVADGRRVQIPQWACPNPVTPRARLRGTRQSFPFLDSIRGHDDATVLARVKADPDGFPWLG